MFWKRKNRNSITAKGVPFVLPQPPAKKEFETMLEILRDAEKYDNAGEYDVCNLTLNNLKQYIDKYTSTAR